MSQTRTRTLENGNKKENERTNEQVSVCVWDAANADTVRAIQMRIVRNNGKNGIYIMYICISKNRNQKSEFKLFLILSALQSIWIEGVCVCVRLFLFSSRLFSLYCISIQISLA